MEQINNALGQVESYLELIAPFLEFVGYVIVAIAALTFVAFTIRMLTGACNGLMKNGARLLIVISILGIAYLSLDIVTGGGANVQKFDFYQQPFWLIVVGALVMGVFFRLFASLRPTRDINC